MERGDVARLLQISLVFSFRLLADLYWDRRELTPVTAALIWEVLTSQNLSKRNSRN